MPIELVPLYTLHVQFRPPITITGTPIGTRMIFEVESIEFEGPGIRGHKKGEAAADWVAVGPDGTGTLDIKATVELDDGALILVQAPGRADFSDPDAWPREVVFAPRYETSDPRYMFLNRVQAIAKGVIEADLKLTAEVFAVR